MTDHHHHGTGPRELQMARSMCWHCQSEVAGEYFCDRCVKVQPVSKETDYFTCFGFPRRLTIDHNKLETKFYELSRAFHPDFYQNKSATEQAISLGNAATLNTTLSFPPGYKSGYCVAVCPAGEDVLGPYLDDRKAFMDTVLRPLQDKTETLYVLPGSPAAKYARRRFPHKPVKEVTGGWSRPPK